MSASEETTIVPAVDSESTASTPGAEAGATAGASMVGSTEPVPAAVVSVGAAVEEALSAAASAAATALSRTDASTFGGIQYSVVDGTPVLSSYSTLKGCSRSTAGSIRMISV